MFTLKEVTRAVIAQDQFNETAVQRMLKELAAGQQLRSRGRDFDRFIHRDVVRMVLRSYASDVVIGEIMLRLETQS